MFNTKTVEIEWGGKTLKLETGRVARQADGAVLATLGETVVLCAVTAAKSVKPGQDFFPLTVHYQEKFSAAGRIPGGFFKRERGATEKETLTSRLIDRPIRPLFPEGFYNEILVIAQVLSYDGENEPDILAMIAASAALTLSGVPFMGPIGAARVGFNDGEYILNPTQAEIAEGRLDLVVAGTRNAVMMVESEAKELSEDVMLGAVMFAHRESQKVIEAIIKLAEQAAKEPWEFSQITDKRRSRRSSRPSSARTSPPLTSSPTSRSALTALNAARVKAAEAFAEADPQEQVVTAKWSSRSRPTSCAARSSGRPPDRRPRHQDRAPDRDQRRLPAAHPRLRFVHPRRNPGDRLDHARHQGIGADDRRPRGPPPSSASSCSTMQHPPALIGRRALALRRSGSARDRSRQLGVARASPDAEHVRTSKDAQHNVLLCQQISAHPSDTACWEVLLHALATGRSIPRDDVLSRATTR